MQIIMFKSGFSQPKDKGILLKDIIEGGTVDQKYMLSDKLVQGFANKKSRYEANGKGSSSFGNMNVINDKPKCPTITARIAKCSISDPYLELRSCKLRDAQPKDSALCHHVATATDIKANEANKRVYADTGKSPTVTTCTGGHREPKILVSNACEEWKEVDGLNFLVSSNGRLKASRSMKIVSGSIDKYGYLKVSSRIKGSEKRNYSTVHRLVAIAFIENKDNKAEVNHIDGNKLNNAVSNLEWCTHEENQAHRRDVLRTSGSKPNKPKGVRWCKEKGKWEAGIKLGERHVFLGRYEDKAVAYAVYFFEFVAEKGYEPWDIFEFPNESTAIVNYMNKEEPKVLIGAIRGRYIVDGKRADHKVDSMAGKTEQRLEVNKSEKSNCLTTVQKDNVLVLDPPKYRKLTPRECMRLQGFTEEIIDKLLNAGISNSQLYKMTGNSFTLPVIIHNLQQLLNTGWMGYEANQ